MSEKIEDIVRDIRRSQNGNVHTISAKEAYALADRIEAAAKALEADRDNWRRQALDEDARANATHNDSLAVGDMAAIREALDAINRIDTRGLNRLLYVLVEADIFDGGQINKTISSVDKAKAAVNAPPRQTA